MTIAFAKVGTEKKPIRHEQDGMVFEGTLRKVSRHRVLLEARLSGAVALDCDRCAKEYDEAVNEPVVLTLSDEVVKDKEDLDIIEFLDGVIDITYLAESEINAFKSTYHYCPECSESDEDFQKEF